MKLFRPRKTSRSTSSSCGRLGGLLVPLKMFLAVAGGIGNLAACLTPPPRTTISSEAIPPTGIEFGSNLVGHEETHGCRPNSTDGHRRTQQPRVGRKRPFGKPFDPHLCREPFLSPEGAPSDAIVRTVPSGSVQSDGVVGHGRFSFQKIFTDKTAQSEPHLGVIPRRDRSVPLLPTGNPFVVSNRSRSLDKGLFYR
ncbi:unnamed protein product [Pseudo-nitzschia multistriata]|uniref:Uncharacterized protein n=1 Tax=Pseudo-nitzschia multistriata TaxID=183589 RepID=A0A448ZPJ2_9STRA|nr:unnamed protein product [Pseudo-nitzschia multistriata]